MIRTIIFDNHNVLTTGDTEEVYQKFSDLLQVDPAELKAVWDRRGKEVDKGKYSTNDYLRKIRDDLKSKASLKSMKNLYFEIYSARGRERRFAKELKDKYELALLTNFGDAFNKYNKTWQLDKIFKDKIFVSAYLKMRKPNPEIYRYVLAKLGRKPEEVLLIDDNKDCIKSAKSIGIKSILFKDITQLKNDLRKYITI